MCGTFIHLCLCEHLRACEHCVFSFLMRSRAVIKFVLQAESALLNTDGKQRALRYKFSAHYNKNSGNFRRKSNGMVFFSLFRQEYSGPPLDRSDRSDRKLTKRLISRSSSVDFSYIGDFGKE